ncbi:MAG TPA: hypothetical protein VHT27_03335 [Solirubrobacteraceae bacterium]|nr:hypothetical protein [Solirubrobacteraceae bacterium]
MSEDIDAFDRLELERERTLFMLYGARKATGGTFRGYFKLAHSLSQAMADLEANPAIAGGPYLVKDAFVEAEEDDAPTVHVELVSVPDLLAQASEQGDD